MPVSGAKPRADRSGIRHRVSPTHEWTEVPNVPFTKAPPLRPRATGGVSVMAVGAANSEDWPQATKDWWADISAMPHAAIWGPGEWRLAMDSAEVHARVMEGWRGYTGAQLVTIAKQLGQTADQLRDLRIRYVEPKKTGPVGVVPQLDDYRGL